MMAIIYETKEDAAREEQDKKVISRGINALSSIDLSFGSLLAGIIVTNGKKTSELGTGKRYFSHAAMAVGIGAMANAIYQFFRMIKEEKKFQETKETQRITVGDDVDHFETTAVMNDGTRLPVVTKDGPSSGIVTQDAEHTPPTASQQITRG